MTKPSAIPTRTGSFVFFFLQILIAGCGGPSNTGPRTLYLYTPMDGVLALVDSEPAAPW